MGRYVRVIAFASLTLLGHNGCRQQPATREYQVVGQITAVSPATSQITIRHQDIKGFMPGMTMPFKVKDEALLKGRQPGELVEATLAVQDTDAWLTAVRVTGRAPLPDADATPVRGLAPGDQVPDAAFIDQDGREFTLRALDGHPAVLTFVYTRCPLPDFCPAIDSRFVAVQRAIRERPALAGVRLVSLTIDPQFDQPDVLRAHAVRLQADPRIWRFVTASEETTAAFGRQFGLAVTRTGSGPLEIEHNLRTVVLAPDRRIVEVLTGTRWQASELVATLERLKQS